MLIVLHYFILFYCQTTQNVTDLLSEESLRETGVLIDVIPGTNKTYSYEELFAASEDIGKPTEVDTALTKVHFYI